MLFRSPWQKTKYGDGCYKTSKVIAQSCGAPGVGTCQIVTFPVKYRNIRWRGDVQYFSDNFDNYGYVNVNAGSRASCMLEYEAFEFRIGNSYAEESFKTLDSKEYSGNPWNNYTGTLFARVVDYDVLLKKKELGIRNGECHWKKEGKLAELKKLYDDNVGKYSLSITIIEDYHDKIGRAHV